MNRFRTTKVNEAKTLTVRVNQKLSEPKSKMIPIFS